MEMLLAALVVLALQEPLPPDAQKIVVQADAKLDALRKSYEEACAKIKLQELKDLQRIHESVKKGDPAGATAIKGKIEALSADVSVVAKGRPTIEQWLQGKWVMSGVVDKNFGEVWEFKGEKIVGAGIGDRVAGKVLMDGGKIQIVWDSGLVEFLRVPDVLGDEITGVCRTGEMKAKRMRP